MRRLTIADTMELENVLDFIPEGKRSEAVAYLQSIYGIENESEYFEVDKYEYLELFDEKEIIKYLELSGYEVVEK